MSEDRLAKILRATADELMASFNRTATLKHEGGKGSVREHGVLAFVRGRLPGGVVAAGSSEVVDATGAKSLQQDIVIADATIPPFFDEGHQRVYPAECVHGVIEVKSHLTKREVVDACEKIASVKCLAKSAYRRDPHGRSYPDPVSGEPLWYRPTFGYVFAYGSKTRLEALTDNVITWCENRPPSEWPDGMFVLGRGTMCWFHNGNPYDAMVRGGSLGFIESSHPRDVLLCMALTMHSAFASAWMPPFRLHAYLANSGLGVARWAVPSAPRHPLAAGREHESGRLQGE